MPKPIISGTNQIIAKPYEVTYNPTSGQVWRYRFTASGGADALWARKAQADAAGWTTRLRVDPVLSELEITSPEAQDGSGGGTTEIVTDTWQIEGNEVNESVFANPIITDLISADNLTVIAAAIRENTRLDQARLDMQADFLRVFAAVESDEALQLYRQLKKGQDSYSVGQYVLKHTTNCSASWGGNVSDLNVEGLYTTAQLLAEVTDASLWINPLPGRLQTKIGAIEPTPVVGPDADWYLWSWKKLPSTETTLANGRIEINTTYTLYNWSTLLYYAV